MRRREKDIHLFELKDYRFGCLSQSSAVAVYHWFDFLDFLHQHDYITNKLACLVRDSMQFDYIIVVLIVVAAFGIHLISPLFIKTKGKATHSDLKLFFTKVHTSLLNDSIDERFFQFLEPCIDGVSKYVFDTLVKTEYGVEVVQSMKKEAAAERIDECIHLANILRIKLADVLERQRGEYYGFGQKQSEQYYVFDQVFGVDKTVTNNLELERQCGGHCNRLNKKANIATVSRGNLLKRTIELRDKDAENSEKFRKTNSIVKEIENIEAKWNRRQEELREVGLTKKEQQAIHVANRRNEILASLKVVGGPFTNADEVDMYLATENDAKTSQQRMKNEITYFRDTCTSLPRTCILFKIMTVDKVTKKRRQMTAEEYSHNLKVLLGKVSDRTNVNYDDFQAAIWHFND